MQSSTPSAIAPIAGQGGLLPVRGVPASAAGWDSAPAPPPEPKPVAGPVLPNPQLRLDAALGLVVIEFRDLRGQSRTIPTERELDAYRSNARPAEAAPPPPATPSV